MTFGAGFSRHFQAFVNRPIFSTYGQERDFFGSVEESTDEDGHLRESVHQRRKAGY
jgi:hypothetical protein